MRQLIVALATFSVFFQASAFKDVVVHEKTRALVELLPQMSPGQRTQKVEEFKNDLFELLNTMPIPNTPEEDEEYASITEFSGYVNMIETTGLNKAKCDSMMRDIRLSTGSEEVATEAKMAIHISAALCK
ncbi:hypothetical protein [Bdellovibrio sp. HCB2-146]|uniref:hypothetical protein n=1 Tax=Bdellovibrio sp. HCB2-146 TaxID=3394362 RepID=UPI0039BC30AF